MHTHAPQTDGSCCDGTGYADYAAVPCPNPHCTATPPAPTLAGHTWASEYIAVETADRLINRAYRAALDGDGATIRRAMAALADTAISHLPPGAYGGIFAPAHTAALAVVNAYLQAHASGDRELARELTAPDSDWTAAGGNYSARAAEFSAMHVGQVGGLAFSDEIAAAARDNVRTALHLPADPGATR